MDKLLSIPVPYTLKSKERLYFLHIDKTAGQSFSQLVETFYRPDEVLIVHPWKIKNISQNDLLQYSFYTGHHGYRFLDTFSNEKPLWITMLRDPVERIISNYYFYRQQARIAIENETELTRDIALTLEYDLYTYLTRPITTPPVHNRQARYLFDEGVTLSEKFTQTPSNDILDTIKYRLAQECTFLGISERFDDSVALFYYTMEWRPHRLTHNRQNNVTQDKPNTDDIDPKVIDLIRERNQLDIELYQFAQELFSKRYTAMMQQLLFQNYTYYVPQNLNPKSQISLRYDDQLFDTKEFAQGWHSYDDHLRWTGPKTISLIDVFLDNGLSYEIVIKIERGVAQEILESFQLFVNRHPITLSQHIRENATQYIGSIPNHILHEHNRLTEIAFCVDDTSRLIDNLEDTRQLGIALLHIDIYPQAS